MWAKGSGTPKRKVIALRSIIQIVLREYCTARVTKWITFVTPPSLTFQVPVPCMCHFSPFTMGTFFFSFFNESELNACDDLVFPLFWDTTNL